MTRTDSEENVWRQINTIYNHIKKKNLWYNSTVRIESLGSKRLYNHAKKVLLIDFNYSIIIRIYTSTQSLPTKWKSHGCNNR